MRILGVGGSGNRQGLYNASSKIVEKQMNG